MMSKIHAQDEPNIIGNWVVETANIAVTVPAEQFGLDQEYIELLQFYISSGMYSAEEFLDQFGFPMPTSQEEWDEILTNGITMEITDEEIDIIGFSITESLFGILVDEEGVMPIGYVWSSDSTISFTSTSEEYPFNEFTVLSVTDNNLTLASLVTIIEDEDGEEMEITYDLIFYCSSAEEFMLGCTDPSAFNYDADANIDDGSCEYPYPCTSNELLLKLEDEESDGWEGSELIINGTSYTLEDGDEETFCIELADCWGFYTIEGDNMNEASWTISDENGEIIAEGMLPYNNNDVDEDGECDDLKIEELSPENSSLIKVIDILGREYKEHHKDMVLLYIYENGHVIKKINAE
tara:strand:- start:395 stop:1447 length:1053 start_codon:yes stop_codon:yes gene_type:complete